MIFLLVLISPYLIFILVRLVECRPDKSVYEVSRPLAEAVVQHVQKYGRPSDLKKVENLPYELVPCSEKPKEFECRDYFFEKDGRYYTAYLEGLPLALEGEHYTWMDLKVKYNYTLNRYALYDNGNAKKITDLSVHAFRSPVGICAHFSF